MVKDLNEVNSQAIGVRDISVITEEIKELNSQAQRVALWYIIEIGRRLEEAKSLLPHGEWGRWLGEEVNFSQSTANNFMKLYREYGASQITLFGAVSNSQAFANLPYTKALQLLAIPADEREEFAREVGAEDLSNRELAAAIKEREQAQREAEEARARERELSDRVAEAEAAREEAERKAKEADSLRSDIDKLKADLEKEHSKSEKLKKKYEDAKANPELPPEKLEELRREAEEAAKASSEAASKENAEELQALRDKLAKAEASAEASAKAQGEAEERLADAEKRIKAASPEVSEFKAVYEELQRMTNGVIAKLSKINENDPDTAQKLLGAVHALGDALKSTTL